MDSIYLMSKEKLSYDDILLLILKASFAGKYVFHAGNYWDWKKEPDIQIFTQNEESLIWVSPLGEEEVVFCYNGESYYYALGLRCRETEIMLNYCIKLLEQGDFYIRNVFNKLFDLDRLIKSTEIDRFSWMTEELPQNTECYDLEN